MNWVLIILCLLFSFLFSGTEAGILSLNRLRLRHLARQKDRAALQLEQVLESPARLLVTVLLVTNLLNILALVLIANVFVSWLGRPGYLLASLAALPLFVLVVELLPKAVFRRLPYRALASLAIGLETASIILTPVIYVGAAFAKHALGLQRSTDIFVAREDLKYVTSEIERMGMLTSTERQLIHNVVDFRSVRVADIMVRFVKNSAVQLDASFDQVIELSQQSRHDCCPVIDESGRVIGVLNVFDLITDDPGHFELRRYLRRVLKVKPDELASIVLRRLRASPQSLAVVVDTEGLPVGLISAEELLNPLVKKVA